MSASREKQRRKEESTFVTESTKKKAGMAPALKTVLVTAAVLIFVLAVVFFTMLNGGFFAAHTTAAVIGSHNLSPAMVNYYYTDAYNTFCNQYSSYISYMLDTESPLSDQACTMPDYEDGATWADYFMDQGIDQAKLTYAMYDAAVSEGLSLTEEDEEQIETYIDNFKTYATIYGLSSADGYIAAVYGKGCNEKSFREYMTVTTLASNYTTNYSDSLSFTAEEIDAEYKANAADYDTVDYRSFYISYSDYLKDGEEEATDEEKAAAMADAQTMADACTDEDAFIELCKENATETSAEYYEDESYTLREGIMASYTDDATTDWLFDEARQYGDVGTLETDTGVYVLFFLERGHNDTKLVDVRHILFGVDDTTDTEAMENAKQQAEEVLAEYQAGEQTEDAFAELAVAHSTDGNAEEGGLYENVHPGQMVTTFNDWCFDENRQTGDVEIIETEYGYHIVYFVKQCDQTYREYLVEQALKNNAYDAWESEKLEGIEVTFDRSMMKYTDEK